MTFLWPSMLLLGLAIPVGALVYRRMGERRGARLAAAGLPAVAPGADRGSRRARFRRWIPGAYVVAGLGILVLAMARPQAVVSTPRIEGTVVLAFDVSGSMAADDIDPTRMEAAKAAARAFVEAQPATIRIGVVAFSDTGFSVQVPTNDPDAALAAIDRLEPERGTSLGRGILASLSAIDEAEADDAAGFYSDRSPAPTPQPTAAPPGSAAATIVLLSDGENTDRLDPIEAAHEAAFRGVRIHTVGIGSEAGATIEVEGFRIHSQLDPAMLESIASITDGTYHQAADADALTAVYDEVGTRLVLRPEPTELTSYVAGLGVLVLLVGGLASLAWTGRFP